MFFAKKYSLIRVESSLSAWYRFAQRRMQQLSNSPSFNLNMSGPKNLGQTEHWLQRQVQAQLILLNIEHQCIAVASRSSCS